MIKRILIYLFVLWLGGFAWFIWSAPQYTLPPEKSADAIVAFTGGRERLQMALTLLVEGHAPHLFISGVGENVSLAELLEAQAPEDIHQEIKTVLDAITLGRNARNTRGNAEETADWLKSKPIRSIILVTSQYHMPRSLVELKHAVPTLNIYPFSVNRRSLGKHWDLWLLEYHKTLWAWTKIQWKTRVTP